MGTLLQNPSNVPVSVSADWETLVNTNAAGNAGKNMISMTNWDGGTLAPSVAAGSIIEIGGSLAYFETEQLPGGIATGINYLKFTVSGTTVTPVWTLTAPTWDAAKGGWYSGSDRYSGHVVLVSGSSYEQKYIMGRQGEICTAALYNRGSGNVRTFAHGIANALSRIISVDATYEYRVDQYWAMFSPTVGGSIYWTDTNLTVVSDILNAQIVRASVRFRA